MMDSLAMECSIGCIHYQADVDSNALFMLFEDRANKNSSMP
jgi:hypothetical protein